MRTLLLFVLLLPQSAPPPLFEAGNAHFVAGEYASAHAAFLAALGTGQASAALYYNLANTYVRLDSLGQAIQYFEKARLLSPEEPRIAHNLAQVRARLGLTDRTAPDPYWVSAWSRLRQHLAPTVLWWVGFAVFLLFTGLAALRIWQGHSLPWLRRSLVFTGILAALLLGTAFAQSAGLGISKRAVVLEQTTLSGAAGSSESVLLAEGTIVEIVSEESGQAFVRHYDGRQGRVDRAVLGDI